MVSPRAPLLLLALLTVAPGPRPGEPRYVLPWNREPKSWIVDLAPPGEPGPRFSMFGHVIGLDGRPAANVTVYAYHADSSGSYWPKGAEPYVNRLGAVLRTNSAGAYWIRSVLPGQYEGPPHIHLEAWGKGISRRVLGVSLFEGPGLSIPMWPDPSIPRSWNRSRYAIVTRDSSGAYRCRFDLELSAMYPTGARYDSLLEALRQRLEK
jgi:protocatechuate 3,4-dioxygenase beta subunit